MARSRKASVPDALSEETIMEDAPIEEIPTENTEEEISVPSKEEEEEALREHLFFLTRGRTPVPVQPMAEWIGDPPSEPEPEKACSFDEWIQELKHHSRPLLAAFRIIATRNGWYYAPPSFWEHQFTSWMHEPI